MKRRKGTIDNLCVWVSAPQLNRVDFFSGQLLTFSMIAIFYTTQSVDFFNGQTLTFSFAKNRRVTLSKVVCTIYAIGSLKLAELL